jgi:hypothetical protein
VSHGCLLYIHYEQIFIDIYVLDIVLSIRVIAAVTEDASDFIKLMSQSTRSKEMTPNLSVLLQKILCKINSCSFKFPHIDNIR